MTPYHKLPYHKLPKQERTDMLRKAAKISARLNPDYQMSAEQVRWFRFMRGEK